LAHRIKNIRKETEYNERISFQYIQKFTKIKGKEQAEQASRMRWSEDDGLYCV
jgi:hypothetical protein